MTDTNLWDLFHSHFKIGEDLIVIDTEDNVFIGRYVAVSEIGITLKGVFAGREKVHEWDDVRFIGHDGFPVRKLMGADGSPSIEKEFKKGINAVEAIRLAMCEELKTKELKPKPRRQTTRVHRSVWGCPIMIDDCDARIVNPGNSLQTHWSLWDYRYANACGYEHSDWEEALVLTAPNGAKAELYDFESIYHFDLAPPPPSGP